MLHTSVPELEEFLELFKLLAHSGSFALESEIMRFVKLSVDVKSVTAPLPEDVVVCLL